MTVNNAVVLLSVFFSLPVFGQQLPPAPPGQVSNFIPQQTTKCRDPSNILNCYIQYLGKYNIRPLNGYLPPFMYLERYVKTQIDLINACRDFDELQQCLGANAATCVNVPVFSLYTQRSSVLNEAIFYTQNHAFFEFVCGVGRPIFLANSECLGRAFAGASLTKRMHRCAQGTDLTNNCPAAVTMATCVKANMEAECGVPAGVASCGAATNIIRREEDIDAGCLYQMDQICSSTDTFKLLFSIILLVIFWLWSR